MGAELESNTPMITNVTAEGRVRMPMNGASTNNLLIEPVILS